jgi:hypothetical protein
VKNFRVRFVALLVGAMHLLTCIAQMQARFLPEDLLL